MDKEEDLDKLKCCITNRTDIIDDAGIYFEFGYGSDRDMQRFDFPLVQDEVAEQVLGFVQSLMVEGRTIDDFKTDFLNGIPDSGHRCDTRKESS